MMAAAAGRRPAAGEGVEHAEPERGPGRGRDVIAPGRAIERRMDGATKGQIDELVTAAGAVVGRLADGGAAGSAGLVGGPVAGVRGGLTGRMVVGSGLLLVVVGVAFAVLLVSVAELRTATRLARHSQEVLVAANQLERLVIDLETGQRGFVITGQERFLGPWRGARPGQHAGAAGGRRPGAAAAGAAAPAGGEVVCGGLLGGAGGGRAAGPGSGANHGRHPEGKRRVDAIRGEFDRLIGTEQGLAVARQQRADGAARRAIGAAAGGLAGSVLLIGGLAGYLARPRWLAGWPAATWARACPSVAPARSGGCSAASTPWPARSRPAAPSLDGWPTSRPRCGGWPRWSPVGCQRPRCSPPWPRRPAGCWAPTPRTCCATSTTPPSPWSPAGAATARPCRSGRAPPSGRRPCRH